MLESTYKALIAFFWACIHLVVVCSQTMQYPAPKQQHIKAHMYIIQLIFGDIPYINSYQWYMEYSSNLIHCIFMNKTC